MPILLDRVVVGFPVVDSESRRMATVVGAPAEGEIYDIKFFNGATGRFQTTPPTLYPKEGIGLSVKGRNTASYYQDMYFHIRFLDPSGYPEWGFTTSPESVAPGSYISWEQAGFSVDNMVGDWTAEIKLYAE